MTSHSARKSMTVTGPVWTCGKCEEPWPCETERLGQEIDKLLNAIGMHRHRTVDREGLMDAGDWRAATELWEVLDD